MKDTDNLSFMRVIVWMWVGAISALAWVALTFWIFR